jgi:hypothetical protein
MVTLTAGRALAPGELALAAAIIFLEQWCVRGPCTEATWQSTDVS